MSKETSVLLSVLGFIGYTILVLMCGYDAGVQDDRDTICAAAGYEYYSSSDDACCTDTEGIIKDGVVTLVVPYYMVLGRLGGE